MRVYLLLFALLPTLAFGQSAEVKKYINASIALYENLEYEKALKQLQKARLKSQGAEDDARISLVEGIIYAEMGKDEKADNAFRTGFSLDPDIKLPVEVSPKVEAVANKTRESVRKMLAPQLEKQRQEEEAKRQAEAERKKAEEDRMREEQHHREEAEMRARNNPPPPLEVEHHAGLRQWAWAPAVVGVAGVVAGSIFFVDAKSKFDALNTLTVSRDQAVSYRDSGSTAQTMGWVFMGVGAVGLAVAAAFLPFPSRDVPKVSFYASPDGGGALFTLELP
jgi:tetratricopeptide (TPR) repeat protein